MGGFMNYFLHRQENLYGKCDGILHEIKKNDTLYNLSRLYKVSLNQILEKNPYVDVYNLRIGDKLCIPMAYRTYIIKQEATLDEFLKRFDVTYEQFRNVNPQLKSFVLPENEMVYLPENARVLRDVEP